MKLVDNVFHVTSYLSQSERKVLEQVLCDHESIASVKFSPGRKHFLSVAYDPETISSHEILQFVGDRGIQVNRMWH